MKIFRSCARHKSGYFRMKKVNNYFRKFFRLLRHFVVALSMLLVFSCGQFKKSKFPEHIYKFPEGINSLISLYAETSNCDRYTGVDYSALEMFPEDDDFFIRYIKNGKPLDKIRIEYTHTEKKESMEYYFLIK